MSSTWLAAFALLTVLLAINSVLLVAMMRQIGILSLRIRPVGAMEGDGETGPVASTVLKEVNLELAMEGSIGNRHDAPFQAELSLLLFVSPTCSICKHLLKPAAAIARDHVDLPVFLLSDVPVERAREYGTRMGTRLPFWVAPELFDEWKVKGTPFAAVVDQSRTVVRSGVANSLEHLEVLVDRAIADSQPHEDHLIEQPLKEVAFAEGGTGHEH